MRYKNCRRRPPGQEINQRLRLTPRSMGQPAGSVTGRERRSGGWLPPLALALACAFLGSGCGSAGHPGAAVGASPTPRSPLPTGTLVTTLTVGTVGGEGSSCIAVDPAMGRVDVGQRQSGLVASFDAASDTVAALAPVYRQPDVLAVDSGNGRIYTANEGTQTAGVPIDPGVTVIDEASGKVLISLLGQLYPSEVAVNPVTHKVYVVNSDPTGAVSQSNVTVLDPTTYAITRTIRIGNSGSSYTRTAAVDASRNRIYIPNGGDQTISVINGATDSVAATFGPYPFESAVVLAVNTSDNRLYALDENDNQVLVLDAASGSQIGSPIPVGNGSNDIAVDPAINRAYVTNASDNSLTVIDGATGDVRSTLDLGFSPWLVAVNSTTHRIYVTCGSQNTVTVLDGTKI